MTQKIELPSNLVVLSYLAKFFFFSLHYSSYKWLLSPNPMELNHLLKGYLAYKTLTRAAINQIKRRKISNNYSHKNQSKNKESMPTN